MCDTAAAAAQRVNAGLQIMGGCHRHRSSILAYDHGNDPEAVEPAEEEACGPQLVGQLLSACLCPGHGAAMLRM